MIQTDKEVIEQLKLLRSDRYSQPEDLGFSALVWAKVSTPSQPIFTLKPVFALTALSTVLFLLFWTYYLPSQKKGDRQEILPVPFFSSVPIVGAVLETIGDSTLTPYPLPKGEGRVREKSIIEEGDLLATGPDGQMTFFLPGVGYFHLAQDSKIEIRKARHVAVPGTVLGGEDKGEGVGGFQYELFLEEGGLYSQLSKLDSASSLNYLTHFGTVSVTGTDLLLNVKKDSGLSVEVLNGEVMVASEETPDDYKNVKEGFRALISPNMSGTLLITELEGVRLAELNEEFTQIFKDSEKKYARDKSNLQIVSYREIKWKK